MADTGRWDPKDPDEIKDYVFDWVNVLDGDAIASSIWEIVSGEGLTIDSDSSTSTTTTVWLSDGVVGITYPLLNRVTTTGGRTYDRTRKLKMKSL